MTSVGTCPCLFLVFSISSWWWWWVFSTIKLYFPLCALRYPEPWSVSKQPLTKAAGAA